MLSAMATTIQSEPDSPTLHIRLRTPSFLKLKELARAEDRPMSVLARHLIDDGLLRMMQTPLSKTKRLGARR
jgi:hypothetical protein